MISKFLNLDIEKRERIINAALNEFAQKGYKNASTNEIVKKAQISKGLLFHYFKNKKNLYIFLFEYSTNIFIEGFYSKFDYGVTDIIKRWRQIVQLKIELIQNHCELYNFMLSSVTDDSIDIEIKKELESSSNNITQDFYKRLFENIDTSVFKEGTDIKRVSEIIIWVVQGFSNSELEKLKHNSGHKLKFNVDEIMADFDEYIELLKNAFYK
jgi:TetR/AcrR family transcriptional regulator